MGRQAETSWAVELEATDRASPAFRAQSEAIAKIGTTADTTTSKVEKFEATLAQTSGLDRLRSMGDSADESIKKLQGSLQSLQNLGFLGALGGTIMGAVSSLRSMGIEAERQQKLEAGLASALRMRGDATGETAHQLEDLNATLARNAGVTRSTSVEVEKMLATYGVAPKLMEAATRAAFALAKATGEDVVTAAQTVAKVFEGQYTVLHRHGFAVNSVAEAMDLLVNKLDKADVAQTGAAASSARLRVALEGLELTIGSIGYAGEWWSKKLTTIVEGATAAATAIQATSIAFSEGSKAAADYLHAVEDAQLDALPDENATPASDAAAKKARAEAAAKEIEEKLAAEKRAAALERENQKKLAAAQAAAEKQFKIESALDESMAGLDEKAEAQAFQRLSAARDRQDEEERVHQLAMLDIDLRVEKQNEETKNKIRKDALEQKHKLLMQQAQREKELMRWEQEAAKQIADDGAQVITALLEGRIKQYLDNVWKMLLEMAARKIFVTVASQVMGYIGNTLFGGAGGISGSLAGGQLANSALNSTGANQDIANQLGDFPTQVGDVGSSAAALSQGPMQVYVQPQFASVGMASEAETDRFVRDRLIPAIQRARTRGIAPW